MIKTDLAERACLRKPLEPVRPFEARRPPFDNRLTVRHAHQRAREAPPLDGERVVAADPLGPRQRLYAVEKRLEALSLQMCRAKRARARQSARGYSRGRSFPASLEHDAPCFGRHLRGAHLPQLVRHKPSTPRRQGHTNRYAFTCFRFPHNPEFLQKYSIVAPRPQPKSKKYPDADRLHPILKITWTIYVLFNKTLRRAVRALRRAAFRAASAPGPSGRRACAICARFFARIVYHFPFSGIASAALGQKGRRTGCPRRSTS